MRPVRRGLPPERRLLDVGLQPQRVEGASTGVHPNGLPPLQVCSRAGLQIQDNLGSAAISLAKPVTFSESIAVSQPAAAFGGRCAGDAAFALAEPITFA